MEGFRREKSPIEGKGENDEIQWITVNGAHIPIKEGETVEQVFKNNPWNSLKNYSKDGIVLLPRKEYGRVCHIVKSKYANDIPHKGAVNDADNFYIFTYDKEEDLILCTFKTPITAENNKTNYLEDGYVDKN